MFSDLQNGENALEKAWAYVLQRPLFVEQMPNLTLLAEAVVSFPASSAHAERGFSTQNRIKEGNRINLAIPHLSAMIRISMDGPPVADYDLTDAYLRWQGRALQRGRYHSSAQTVGSFAAAAADPIEYELQADLGAIQLD